MDHVRLVSTALMAPIVLPQWASHMEMSAQLAITAQITAQHHWPVQQERTNRTPECLTNPLVCHVTLESSAMHLLWQTTLVTAILDTIV
jgi:hypothetical protein